MTAPDREAPSTSWAVWAWEAYREGRLVDASATPAPDAAVKRVVDLLDDLTERQWVIDGLTMSELKEITDAIGAVREVQSHKSK